MKKLYFFITGLLIISGLTGCQTKDTTKIEQGFEKVLAMYPTPNLEDFYDMEGYRDDEFDANDKGVWVLNSRMSISSSEDSGLVAEGMLLRINRNNNTAIGYYYIDTTWDDLSKSTGEQRYPVTYDSDGFHLIEDISDAKLKEKITNFKFFVQYGQFNELDSYENIRKMYNSSVPMYELEYQLTNEEPNVQALRERYDIPIDDAPTLLLKGTGDLEGNSVGYKQLEFRFSKNPSVMFNDFIDFQPLSEEDKMNG